jgi:hypothetical protein
MADGQQMNYVLSDIKCVDDSIIADAQAAAFAPSYEIVRKTAEAKPHFIDFHLNPITNIFWKPEKGIVEPGIINL